MFIHHTVKFTEAEFSAAKKTAAQLIRVLSPDQLESQLAQAIISDQRLFALRRVADPQFMFERFEIKNDDSDWREMKFQAADAIKSGIFAHPSSHYVYDKETAAMDAQRMNAIRVASSSAAPDKLLWRTIQDALGVNYEEAKAIARHYHWDPDMKAKYGPWIYRK